MSFFGLFDRVFPGWDPGLDRHTPSIWLIMLRHPKHSSQEHRYNLCRKLYNRQWACRRVYPLRLRHFQHHFPDIVPKDHRPESFMPLLLSAFFIAAGLEWWCHNQARILAVSCTASFIPIYHSCVRCWCNPPMFRAFSGTTREANNRSHYIQFDTDSYRIGIDTFPSGCMSPKTDHFIIYKGAEVQ